MIDLYCERTAAGLLAEPLNLISNAGFFVAAAAALAEGRARGQRESVALAATLGAIGAGSTLFHAFASAWALWLDVVPIAVFELGFLAAYLSRLLGWSAARAGAALLAFAAALALAGAWPQLANGSLGYVPAALVLGLLGWEHWRCEQRSDLAVAALLFALSLVARSVDNAWCVAWPHGTHWLWHLLNAAVLYLALRAYMRSIRRTTLRAPRRA